MIIGSAAIGRPFEAQGNLAAVDTIEAHFRDLNIDASQYDLIATGDLGRVGHRIAGDLLKKHGKETIPCIAHAVVLEM